MIKICKKQLLRAVLPPLRRPSCTALPLTFLAGYSFGSKGFGNILNKSFPKDLKKQIEFLEGEMQKIDNTDNQKYFQENGWKINYQPEKTLFQFSKSIANREVKVFCGVTGEPPNESTQGGKVEQDKNGKKLRYSRVAIWLRREKGERWLVAQMGISDGSVDLTTLFSTSLTPGIDFPAQMYNGPDVQTLPSEILQSINFLLSQVGLSTEMIMNMVIHSSSKADQLDLLWMKDLNHIISE